jgi:hypothetical protein
MYKAIIIKLKNVRPHPNADRLKLATCEGNQVVVGLDANEGDLGIYFPTDGQLSEEFCKANDLIRRKDEHGNAAGGMFDANRRVRTQKFRGEKSDGFWCPINYLKFNVFGQHAESPLEGFEFDSWHGVPVCNKYVAPATKQKLANISGKKAKKGSIMFKEHFDTSHFGRNINKIRTGDHVIITEKVHGTSQRVGYVIVEEKPTMWEKIRYLLAFGKKLETKEKWEYLVGTRRVVLDHSYNKNSGFHSDSLRELAAKPFIGNLRKGETVYYEVVGYEPSGALIMPHVDIRKMKDKEFEARWKKEVPKVGDNMGSLKQGAEEAWDNIATRMAYTYGCERGEHKIFVYRITMTNEDGDSMDYSWKDVKKRCNELGVAYCPELHEMIYRTAERFGNEDLERFVNGLAEGASTLDMSHIREGVCVRVEGGLEPLVMKHKSFEFKVLEGIVKDTGVEDLEEAS